MALPNPNQNNSDVQLKDVLGSFIEIAAQKQEFDQTQLALVGSTTPKGGAADSVSGKIQTLTNRFDKFEDKISGGSSLYDLNETLSKIGIVLQKGLDINEDRLNVANDNLQLTDQRTQDQKSILQLEDKRFKMDRKESMRERAGLGEAAGAVAAPLLLGDKRSGIRKAFDQGRGLLKSKTDPQTEEGQGFLKSAFKTIVGSTVGLVGAFGAKDALKRRAFLESDKVSDRDKRGAELGIAAEVPSAVGGALAGGVAGAKLGGLLGSIFPGIGNLVGAAAGGAIGSAAAFFLGPKAVEAIGPEIEQKLISLKNGLSDFSESMSQKAKDFAKSISDFTAPLKENAKEFYNNYLGPDAPWAKNLTEKTSKFVSGLGESISEFTAPLRDKATEFYTNFLGPDAPWAKTLTDKIGQGTDFVKEGAAKLGKKLGIEELSFKGIDDALTDNFAEVGIPQKEIDLPLFGKFKIGPFFPFRPDAPDLTAEEIKAGEEERKKQIEEEVFREGDAKTAIVDGKVKITGKSESPLDKLTREKIEQGVDPGLAREAAIAERRAEVDKYTDSAREIARNMTAKTVDRISAKTKISDQGQSFTSGDTQIDVGTKRFDKNMENIGGEDQGTSFSAEQTLSTEGSSAGNTFDNLDIFGRFDDATGKATLTVSTDSADKSDAKHQEVPRSIYAMARKMSADNVPAVEIIEAVNKALKEEKLGFMERQGFFESDEDYNKRLAQIEDTFDVGDTTTNIRKGESAVLGEAAVTQLSVQGAGKAVSVGADDGGLTGNADEVIASRSTDDGRNFTIFGDGSYNVADGSGTAKYDKDGKFIHKDTPNIGGLMVRTLADGSTETTMQTQAGGVGIETKYDDEGKAVGLDVSSGPFRAGVREGASSVDYEVGDGVKVGYDTEKGLSTTGGLGAEIDLAKGALSSLFSEEGLGRVTTGIKALFGSTPSGMQVEDQNLSQSQIEGIQRISAESLKDTPGAPTSPIINAPSTDASTNVVNNNTNVTPGPINPKNNDESFNRVNNGNYAYG